MRFPFPVHLPVALMGLAGGGGDADGSAAPAPWHSATVEGVVVDLATTDPVPEAGVRLVAHGRVAHRDRSGDDGSFRLEGVRAGVYTLQVAAPGYTDWEAELEVPREGTVERTVRLPRSHFEVEGLRVPGRPLEVRRETTDFGTRVDSEALERMPIPYDVVGVADFVAGGSADRMWGGADARANLYEVDGIPLTHPGVGGPLLEISRAWTESVEVRGLGAGADEGHFQGAVVDVATRSGGEELEGRVHSRFEAHPLNATNVVEGEVGRERARRVELDGEVGGPLLGDRLRFFSGLRGVEEQVRAQSRMPDAETRFLPYRRELRTVAGFGKLTWTSGSRDRVDLAASLAGRTVDRWGLDGHQSPEATGRMDERSRFASLTWIRGREERDFFRVRAAYAGGSESLEPSAGPETPAVRFFTWGDPPSPTFRNAEFAVDRKPLGRVLAADLGRGFATGWMEHRLTAGVELTGSRWRDLRRRTGGMTWRPGRSGDFDAERPDTWSSGGEIPVVFGGEVNLHARMASASAYLQHRVEPYSGVTVTPGIRWGRWTGDLLPGGRGGEAVRAVEDDAWDPRVGVILEVPSFADVLLKGHWGRFHQPLLAPFFDRAEGGEVFTDREQWNYRGPTPDPGATFTEAERDRMADEGDFRFVDPLPLNQTGPVADDYRQPHVDQWLVGLEAGLGARVRVEAVWMERANRDMVGLRDRNLEGNYRRFENIRIRGRGDGPLLERDDGPVILPAVYVPTDHLLEMLRWRADPETGEGAPPPPPGMELADTTDLAFDEDLRVGNLPDAERRMRQLQLIVRATGDRWDAVASLVHSRLRGNLQSVGGYAAGAGYESAWDLGPGPWAWPNERVNFQGRLPDHSPLEFKLLLHGDLPWDVGGGAFLRAERGERFTPYFQIDWAAFEYETEDGEPLDSRHLMPISGQRVFVDPRGTARYPDRFTLDLRLQREIPVPRGDWSLRVDLLNVWNATDPLRINPAVNFPTRTAPLGPGLPPRVVSPAQVFGAVWERIRSRTVRLGLTARF